MGSVSDQVLALAALAFPNLRFRGSPSDSLSRVVRVVISLPCNWEDIRSCFPATCQAVEGPHDLVGRRGGPEDRFDVTGEGKRNRIAPRVAPPPVSSHKAGARRERVGIIGHHPECILAHQDRHHAFPRETSQMREEQGPAAPDHLR